MGVRSVGLLQARGWKLPFPCFQEVFDRHLADHFQDAVHVDRLDGLAVIRFVDFVLDGPGMVYVMDDIVLPRLDLLVRLQQLHVDMLLFQERYNLDEPSMVFQDQGHQGPLQTTRWC